MTTGRSARASFGLVWVVVICGPSFHPSRWRWGRQWQWKDGDGKALVHGPIMGTATATVLEMPGNNDSNNDNGNDNNNDNNDSNNDNNDNSNGQSSITATMLDPTAPDPSCGADPESQADDLDSSCWSPPTDGSLSTTTTTTTYDLNETTVLMDTLSALYGGEDPSGEEEEKESTFCPVDNEVGIGHDNNDNVNSNNDRGTCSASTTEMEDSMSMKGKNEKRPKKRRVVDKHWGQDERTIRLRDRLRASKTSYRPPIFLLPGLASTRLVSWKNVPCQHPLVADVKNQERLWLNVGRLMEMATVDGGACWARCMTLGENQTDLEDGCKLRPDEGLDAISSLAPSSPTSNMLVGGTNTVYAWLVHWLSDSLGYDVGSMVALPYDWRLTPHRMEERDGFLTFMRRRIEAAVATNGGRPGVLVAHSMGNVIFRYFLEWLRHQMRLEAYQGYKKMEQQRRKARQKREAGWITNTNTNTNTNTRKSTKHSSETEETPRGLPHVSSSSSSSSNDNPAVLNDLDHQLHHAATEAVTMTFQSIRHRFDVFFEQFFPNSPSLDMEMQEYKDKQGQQHQQHQQKQVEETQKMGIEAVKAVESVFPINNNNNNNNNNKNEDNKEQHHLQVKNNFAEKERTLWELAKMEGDETWLEWVNDHIWTYVGLSAPALGAINPLRSVISGERMNLPMSEETARFLELSFGCTHNLNPISTKAGFCDGDHRDDRANLACMEDILEEIEEAEANQVNQDQAQREKDNVNVNVNANVNVTSSSSSSWDRFPVLKSLLKYRADWDTDFPMIRVERERQCAAEEDDCDGDSSVSVSHTDYGPLDVMSGSIFDAFADTWIEKDGPLRVKKEQLRRAYWESPFPNVLNSTWERPHIKHVVMSYGVDFTTEVGYTYRKSRTTATTATTTTTTTTTTPNPTTDTDRDQLNNETIIVYDGIPHMSTIIWEEKGGKLIEEELIARQNPSTSTTSSWTDALTLKRSRPRKTVLKDRGILSHSGDGAVPYLSLCWVHTWLLHATRALMRSSLPTSSSSSSSSSSPLSSIEIAHRPKGGSEWIEGFPSNYYDDDSNNNSNNNNKRTTSNSKKDVDDADTGTRHPAGTKYKPEMVRFRSSGTSRTTGMEYTTTVIEAVGVEHKEITRNYDILAAVFTDVLKFMHDDHDLGLDVDDDADSDGDGDGDGDGDDPMEP